MNVTPYLFFNGTCEEALKFYEKVLGAKIEVMMRYKDMPGSTGQHPPELTEKLMHARMTIAGHLVMASDAPPERFNKPQGFDINLSVETPEEADRIFKSLSEGAQSVSMPIAETFWAHRFGALVDKFGTPWMVNCEKKM
ncbi:MAG: glyoxalase/bleomycin resistance/extradiol dioxygenase family protein [Xanthobacteraceae bacterium]|nr:glyoxalase/bleomycin resistance/extradiol dioxygenase family protein [Xanthobacteraceae bacterium]